MTIKHSEYQALYGDLCKIPVSGFDLWILRSVGEINRYITVPIDRIDTDAARLCVVEVAECLYCASEVAGIKSENTDGYSVTYDTTRTDIYPIIKRYLPEYLYRGVEL